MMLYLFLQFFISLTLRLENRWIVLLHESSERALAPQLDRFSMIETQAIRLSVKSFDAYRFNPIEFEVAEGWVRIHFIDEKAYILYDFKEPLKAILSYDLVFDTSLDYSFVTQEEGLWIDKTGD